MLFIKLISIFFIIVLFVFILIISLFGNIIRLFMPKRRQGDYGRQAHERNKEDLTPNDTEKQFSDKVGEYVDYEEIKEE